MQKYSSGFTLTFFKVLFLLDPGGLARPSGAQEFQVPFPFLPKAQTGTESRQCSGGSEAG